VASSWWRAFDDPVLDALVARALERNVDIAIAGARVEEARAQSRLSHSALSPTLDLGLAGQDARALNALGQTYEAAAGQPDLRVSYEVDLWGRLGELDAAGRASLQASEAASATTRLAVAAAVARAYVSLRSLDAQLEVIRDTAAARARSAHVAQRRSDTGYSSDLEASQARAEVAAAQQRIPALELAIARQENALSLLCGDAPLAIGRGQMLTALALPEISSGVPSDVVRQRPDVASAEAQLIAADASLAASRALLLPQVRLTASLSRLFTETLDDPVTLWSAGGSVLAPLFNGGRIRAQGDVAQARRDQAAAAYRSVVLNAFVEVENALSAQNRLAAQEAGIETQRAALTRAFALAEDRYRAGYASYLEQVDAQRGVLATDLAWLQVRESRLLATIAIAQAVGGGWSDTAPS
jgi:NodT family efflux transporter outer membrane factor (OMF) lipoprotein